MQYQLLIFTLAVMALVAYPFWRVASTASQKAEPAAYAKVERGRNILLAGLTVLGLAVTVVTLRPWPHDAQAAGTAQIVKAVGYQWYWELDKEEVAAGTPVVFEVSSADVNHGFGVYDEDGTVLFQTQVMPGYVNKVKHTFTRPGTYRVLCLEYCGAVHHEMIGEFEVVAAN